MMMLIQFSLQMLFLSLPPSAGLSSYLDFTNPEVREWYADQFAFKTYQVCGFSHVILCSRIFINRGKGQKENPIAVIQ